MKNVLVVVVVVLFLVGAWAAAANLGFAQTKMQTHTVRGNVQQVIVESERGDVDLVAPRRRIQGRGTRPAVTSIEVRERRHWAVSPPKLKQTLTGGVLKLQSTCPAAAVVLKCHSDLRVAVPAEVSVTVRAKSGDVDARGIKARTVLVYGGSGNVEMDLAGSKQIVVVRSDSGHIDIVARFGPSLEATADSGHVTVDVGSVPRPPYPWHVYAGSNSGDVEVAVPRGFYMNLSARSDSGDARVSGLRRSLRSGLGSVLAGSHSGDVAVRGR